MVERRIKAAGSRRSKASTRFDFLALPSLNKMLVLELAPLTMSSGAKTLSRSATAARAKATLRLGSAWRLPERPIGRLSSRHPRSSMNFSRRVTTSGLTVPAATRRLQAADHRRARYVPAIADRRRIAVRSLQSKYERGSTIVTSNLPFDEWTSVFVSRSFMLPSFLTAYCAGNDRAGEGSGRLQVVCHGCPLVNWAADQRPRLRYLKIVGGLNIEPRSAAPWIE